MIKTGVIIELINEEYCAKPTQDMKPNFESHLLIVCWASVVNFNFEATTRPRYGLWIHCTDRLRSVTLSTSASLGKVLRSRNYIIYGFMLWRFTSSFHLYATNIFIIFPLSYNFILKITILYSNWSNLSLSVLRLYTLPPFNLTSFPKLIHK